MNTKKIFRWGLLTALAIDTTYAFPIITNVVETGGDNEATDTVPAKWTGVTFSNGVSGEFLNPYTVGLFGEDVPAYTDRTHQWNGATASLPLPSYLVGGEYIMIGNDNRDNASFKLNISVSTPAIVYLLIDNRLTDLIAADPPEAGLPLDAWTGMTWMSTNGFAPVLNGLNRLGDPTWPDEVGVDESGDGTGAGVAINNWSSVYSKTVPAGTISLYQPDNPSRNMYGVVVTAVPGSVTAPPQILNLSPTNNALFFSSASGVSFTAATVAPNRINATNITLLLNGTDVSTNLVLGADSVKRTVSYKNLKSNTIYSARIVVSDQNGRALTNDFGFDTFDAASTIVVEAEEYNYENGKFLNASPPEGYSGLVGTPEIDYHDINSATPAAQYRFADYVGLAVATDGQRPRFTAASAQDYQVNQFLAGDWLNYTRTFNSATYTVFLRASGTWSQLLRLDKISGDITATNQIPFSLGRFAFPYAPSSGAYAYVPLTDNGGNPVTISLSGINTLRLTALYSPNPTLQLNFLLFVPTTAGTLQPYVSAVTPAFNSLNVPMDTVLGVTVANGTTQVASGSVVLTFNGSNVTSAASVSTSGDGVAVSYDPPGLLATNTIYPVSLVYKDTAGTSFTNQWTLQTVPYKSIITSVVETGGTDSINTPAQFTSQAINHPNLGAITVGTFQEDVPAFRDRVHQWNGASTTLPLPSYLVGGDYIMSRNDNRGVSPYQLDVTVSEPALVYVLVDNRLFDTSNANPPDFSAGSMSWLLDNGWTGVTNGYNRGGSVTVPDEVGYDEGADGVGPGVGLNQWASVYVKTVPAGTVSLYQADNSGNNMYGVVVRAVATHRYVPTVSVTSPANNTAYPAAPTNITITADASVLNSSISKVEFFSGSTLVFAPMNKIGEVTNAPYRFVWTNVNAGRYSLMVKATAANGQSATTLKSWIVVGKVISVNFQAATAVTPDGYLPDYGDIFGDRGNGYSYGWDMDNAANSRERISALSPDKRYDTLNHLQKALPAGRFWEIEVPNGRYAVFAASGDATATDSVYDLQAEGITIVTGTPNANQLWLEGSGVVTVNDGRLTIGNGPASQNNKVCFVDIIALPAEVPKPVFSKPVLNGNTLTISWTSGGKLQEASDVTGPWSNVANDPKDSYTVPTTGSRKFYRVIVP